MYDFDFELILSDYRLLADQVKQYMRPVVCVLNIEQSRVILRRANLTKRASNPSSLHTSNPGNTLLILLALYRHRIAEL